MVQVVDDDCTEEIGADEEVREFWVMYLPAQDLHTVDGGLVSLTLDLLDVEDISDFIRYEEVETTSGVTADHAVIILLGGDVVDGELLFREDDAEVSTVRLLDFFDKINLAVRGTDADDLLVASHDDLADSLVGVFLGSVILIISERLIVSEKNFRTLFVVDPYKSTAADNQVPCSPDFKVPEVRDRLVKILNSHRYRGSLKRGGEKDFFLIKLFEDGNENERGRK